MSRTIRYFAIAVIAIAAASVSRAAEPGTTSARGPKWAVAEQNYMKALSSENAGIRASAAEYLGRYQMKGSINALIEILKSDTSEPVRSAAAFALILMNDEAGIKAVEESSLNDGSDKVATFCTKLLDLHTVRSYVAIFE